MGHSEQGHFFSAQELSSYDRGTYMGWPHTTHVMQEQEVKINHKTLESKPKTLTNYATTLTAGNQAGVSKDIKGCHLPCYDYPLSPSTHLLLPTNSMKCGKGLTIMPRHLIKQTQFKRICRFMDVSQAKASSGYC